MSEYAQETKIREPQKIPKICMHAPGLPCKYKSFGSLGGPQSSALGFQVLEVPATPMQGFKEPKLPQHFHDDRTISLGVGKSNSSRSTTPGLAAPCGLCLRKAVRALILLMKQSVDGFQKTSDLSLLLIRQRSVFYSLQNESQQTSGTV